MDINSLFTLFVLSKDQWTLAWRVKSSQIWLPSGSFLP